MGVIWSIAVYLTEKHAHASLQPRVQARSPVLVWWYACRKISLVHRYSLLCGARQERGRTEEGATQVPGSEAVAMPERFFFFFFFFQQIYRHWLSFVLVLPGSFRGPYTNRKRCMWVIFRQSENHTRIFFFLV